MRPASLAWFALLVTALPVNAGDPPATVHYRDAAGRWQSLPARHDRARDLLTFTLRPGNLPGGRTVVVTRACSRVALTDALPPALTGAKLDGRPLPVRSAALDLDWLPELPRELVVGLRDTEAGLRLPSLSLTVNGVPLPGAALQVTRRAGQDHEARVVARLGDELRRHPQFLNRVTLTVMDAAADPHRLEARWTFRHLGQLPHEPYLLVDSSYGGYEKNEVLLDGKHLVPGETTVGATWASREEAGDHWVVIAWKQPRPLAGVRLYWANYQATYWTARRLLVETWDGQRWVTQRRLTDNHPASVTDIPLEGVTTSRLRITQPDGGGHPGKGPNIFWMDEIEVR